MLCSISKNGMYHQLLEPQLDIVLSEIVFPLMCFNDNDHKLWTEDPHEYVRKGYGELRLSVVLKHDILLVVVSGIKALTLIVSI